MIIYCLTGSIATGKTTISNILKEKGLIIIDTDIIVHNLYKTKKVISLIKDNFGKECTTENEVNRKELAKLVFNNKYELDKLNKLIHPLVKEEVFKLLEFYKNKEKILNKNFFVVYVIPLYFETGEAYEVDKVILAYCPKHIQIERLMKRDNINENEAIKRINNQIDIDEKIIKSHIIINTNKNLNELKNDLEEILKRIYYDKYYE
jgi:dephospho-CoA kinase